MRYERESKRPRRACAGLTFLLALTLMVPMLLDARRCFSAACQSVLKAGVALPKTALPDSSGEKVVLPDSAGGRVAIIHFTSIWCHLCEDEMAVMQLVQTLHGEKGVVSYWINVGESVEPARAYASKVKTSYPVLFDSGMELRKQCGDLSIPLTLVCDGNGVIRGRLIGEVTKTGLEKLLRVAQSGA